MLHVHHAVDQPHLDARPCRHAARSVHRHRHLGLVGAVGHRPLGRARPGVHRMTFVGAGRPRIASASSLTTWPGSSPCSPSPETASVWSSVGSSEWLETRQAPWPTPRVSLAAGFASSLHAVTPERQGRVASAVAAARRRDKVRMGDSPSALETALKVWTLYVGSATVRATVPHGQVVQTATVPAEDQRRDHQADQQRARSSASSRFSGRPSAAEHPDAGEQLAERAAGQGHEQRRLDRRTRRGTTQLDGRRAGVVPRAEDQPTRPAWQAIQSTNRASDPPGARSAVLGQLAARARRSDPAAVVRRSVQAGPPVTCGETNWIRSRNCPSVGSRTSRAQRRTDSPPQLIGRRARPRRTNVRKQRRAAEVHQGRGRRDGRRPVLRPARHHAALHGARCRRSTRRSSTTA